MPLVMMCGLPCSGKTTRARELAEFLDKSKPAHISRVILVNEEALHITRPTAYLDPAAEKLTRGAVKAAVERDVAKDVLVIADYMNSIKGFRYELYCRARASATPHCVVYCDAPKEKCKEWNAGRPAEDQYRESDLDDLLCRFEEPSEVRRWDKPLFKLSPSDSIPFDAIAEAVFHGKTPTVSMATAKKELKEENFLFELDKVTKEVVDAVAAAQTTGGLTEGDCVAVPHTHVMVILSRRLGVAKLSQLRRQFMKVAVVNPTGVSSQSWIAETFVEFVNKNSTS